MQEKFLKILTPWILAFFIRNLQFFFSFFLFIVIIQGFQPNIKSQIEFDNK